MKCAFNELKKPNVVVAYGEITTSKSSWFKLVKHGDLVEVNLRIEDQEIEFIDSFDEAFLKSERWIWIVGGI